MKPEGLQDRGIVQGVAIEFIGWSIDIAREQSPSEDWLDDVLARSRRAGYNAVGLYLEHRFAYRSAPWAADAGCLSPVTVRRLAGRIRNSGPRLIPFINTLGHMEGFIRSEGGQWLSEGPAAGSLQMCPSREECVEFARGLVNDILDAFDDPWIHLGGDETKQLGQCPRCAERAKRIGKAGLYAEYYGPLCEWVIQRGRRPCLWGDMLLRFPEVLNSIPTETVIFDWQYQTRPAESTGLFRQRGFDVVCCPSVQTYNSGWCFLEASQRNIDAHAEDAAACGASGVLVTTWEQCFFSHYASILPLALAAGRRLALNESWATAIETTGGQDYARAAEILGNRIPAAALFLAPATWRQLRDRFVMRLNPFELWRDWRDEACGPAGDDILRLCAEARDALPDDSELILPIMLHRTAVEWVRLVERAQQAYAKRDLPAAAEWLEQGPPLLESLGPHLQRIAAAGGSQSDPSRLRQLVNRAHRAAAIVRELSGDANRPPAFENLLR